jgi:hypothetical protein
MTSNPFLRIKAPVVQRLEGGVAREVDHADLALRIEAEDRLAIIANRRMKRVINGMMLITVDQRQ